MLIVHLAMGTKRILTVSIVSNAITKLFFIVTHILSPIAPKIWLVSRIVWCIKMRKTWEFSTLAYPTVGLSHCLDQDKQLEIAHVVRYCSTNTILPSQTLRLRIFWSVEFARFYGRR